MKFQVKLEAEGLEKCTRGATSTISPVLIFMLIGCRYIKIGEEWIGGMAADSQTPQGKNRLFVTPSVQIFYQAFLLILRAPRIK